MLPFVVLSLAVYLAAHHTHGFIPPDEGLLGQSAERVLRGEWPHRDFDDPYTGLLSLLHAGAMRLFGVDSLALRRVLLVAAIGFSVVVYRLARRAVSPPLAAFVTWGALAWAMSSYFAPLPSWYNLMCAATALLFLLRATERGRRRDVALAGLFGGLSLLVKVAGMFHIAASVLSLLFLELTRSTPLQNVRVARATHAVLRLAALCFALALTFLLPLDATVMERLHFNLPGWLLAAVVIVESMRTERREYAPRLGSLLATFGSYGAGVAVPVLVFVWPYLTSGGTGALVYDVFVAPRQRIEWVTFELPELETLWTALPMAAVVLAPKPLLRVFRRPPALLLLAALLSVALAYGSKNAVYTRLWSSLRPLVPLATLGCALWLFRRDTAEAPRRTQLFCVAAMTALASLVQFPFSFGIYFLYVAPLLVLALAFLATRQPAAPSGLWIVVACFHFGFALAWVNDSWVVTLGTRYFPDPSDSYLALPRGGLWVDQAQAQPLTQLVHAIEAHSDPSAFIYAAPDCPQVYFFSGRRNPTRTFYDRFDRDYAGDQEPRAQRILDSLESHAVDVAVICHYPEFSSRMTGPLLERLEQRFPSSIEVSPMFTLRFRARPR